MQLSRSAKIKLNDVSQYALDLEAIYKVKKPTGNNNIIIVYHDNNLPFTP